MTLTNKLRWKKVKIEGQPYASMTLQQWWEQPKTDINNKFIEMTGEWRDVPIEVEHD